MGGGDRGGRMGGDRGMGGDRMGGDRGMGGGRMGGDRGGMGGRGGGRDGGRGEFSRKSNIYFLLYSIYLIILCSSITLLIFVA